MLKKSLKRTSSSSRPEDFSRFKKEQFLLKYSEDEFRDQVVRPLLLRIGFKDGRDLCGPNEKGKDAVFLSENMLGIDEIYAIQTKKGSLNLSRKREQNVVEACTQLKTALATDVYFVKDKKRYKPDKVILCTSGKINDAAKDYIINEIKDNRIIFMDVFDIVPLIDQNYRELWFGIDAELMPYFRAIKRNVEDFAYNDLNTDLISRNDAKDAATDEMYVPINLYRQHLKTKKVKGELKEVPNLDEIPIQALLTRKHNLMLILGDAGTGKSTILRRLTYILAKKGVNDLNLYTIPILIRAIEIAKQIHAKSLLDICVDETCRLTNSSKPSFSADDLKSGRVILLIDALDEVSKEENKSLIVNSLLSFNEVYPDCKIILTSRENPTLNKINLLNLFTTYYISSIGFKEVGKILKRFERSQSLSEDESKELLRRLQEIHGMELNPLLVSVFAMTSDYNKKDIPANITELFKKFTEVMLGRWDQDKGLEHQYHAPLKDFLLKQIAFELHKDGKTSMDLNQFKSIVAKDLASRGHSADINVLTDEIINRSGLFRLTQDRIEFRHHLLQEFFAGRGVPNQEYLKIIIKEDWWQRAIVFYFGENPNESKAILDVIKSVKAFTKEDLFIATLTLGLSLQASYLLKLDDKITIYNWVLNALTLCSDEFISNGDMKIKFPLTSFITYYLLGRDSIACSIINEKYDEIEKIAVNPKDNNAIKDIKNFWLIISLMECGHLPKALIKIKKFRPADTRLLLAIHLSAFLILHLKVTSKENKRATQQIIDMLSSKIEPLRKKIMEEFKSELLEIRKGKINAIEERKQKLLP
ncbi:MAG TPA: NACHT domain-containing protein [Ignavibacteria bacterium]|jgi:hypothetical protein